MEKQMILNNIFANLCACYNKHEISYDIETLKIFKKPAILPERLYIFEKSYTNEEILAKSDYLLTFSRTYEKEYKINFASLEVTDRKTGKSQTLKKFLAKLGGETYNLILNNIPQPKKYIITDHPYYLLSSSIGPNGKQIDNSCHYPGTSTTGYVSGPTSYGIDNHTILFGMIDDNGYLLGRQLVYVGKNGIVIGRQYGKSIDSSFLRSELYKILQWNKSEVKKAPDNSCRFHKNGYNGYLDNDHFTTYRKNREIVEIYLSKPVCVNCGSNHDNDKLNCSDCDESYPYFCESCGSGCYENEIYCSENGNCYCENCYNERFTHCEKCGCELSKNYDTIVNFDIEIICENCIEPNNFCDFCENYYDETNKIENSEK